MPSEEFGGSFALDLVAFLASEEADRVACVFDFEPGLQGAECDRAASPAETNTLAADKAYDAGEFVHELRSMNATPHVAQNTHHRSLAVDGRTARHAGHAPSQSIRKRIKEACGWIKTIAGQEPTKFRGQERVGWAFNFPAAAYSLGRVPKLVEAA